MQKKIVSRWLKITLMSAALLPAVSIAEEQTPLSDRVDRLERILKSQGLTTLLGRIDQLERDIQRLRGENEELNHRIDEMRESQREMYIDLDERMSEQAEAIEQAQSAPQQDINHEDSAEQAARDVDAELAEVEDNETTSGTSDDSTSENGGSPAAVENGEAAYQSALKTLRSGQYDQAIEELSAFPEEYPRSEYLPNVYYWRGEASYVVRDFGQAIEAFNTVLSDYPDSNKVPDALLKRGFSEYEQDKIDTAKATLQSVINDYPDSSAARLAKVRLDRIEQETQD